MGTFKKISLLVASSLFIFSCEINENEDITTLDNSFMVEENILSFRTSDELKNYVDGLKNDVGSEVIIGKLKKSYEKGFLPLHPQTNDESLIQKIVSEKKNQNNNIRARLIEVEGEIFDVEDDLILDDDFASFLNANREVIVNDTLYTYTVNGVYSTHKTNVTVMRSYIQENTIQEYDVLPNPGIYDTSNSNIKRIIPNIIDPCGASPTYGLQETPYESDIHYLTMYNNDCYSGSPGSGSGSSNPPVNHTQNLNNYINTLTPCSTSNNFMGVFGPDKRCWSSFDSKRRTKTVFWKHNYLVYRSVGVKVKHQKKHWLGWWYASDDNNEIALIIDKAYFKMIPPVTPTDIHNNQPSKHIFFNGNVYNNTGQLLGATTNLNFQLPNLPLNAEFIVADFINNTTGVSLSPNQIKNMVYQQTWNQLVSILQSTLGQNQPQTLNYYLYDTALNEIHFMHINVEERRTGRKKIVKTFDFNLGIGVTFNIYGTNSSGTTPVTTSITFPGLYQYTNASIDFVGVSRKGNVWRGSKLVFED